MNRIHLAGSILVLGVTTPAQLQMSYAPKKATSLIHVDVAELARTPFGKQVAESRIGKALASYFEITAGYAWSNAHRLDIASEGRVEDGLFRPLWVVHARGTKALVVPKLVEALGVDLGKQKTAVAAGWTITGFVHTGPGELLCGDAAWLQKQKVGPTTAPPAVLPRALIRAEIEIPAVD